MAQGPKTRRLATLAEPLKPQRAPFYVRLPLPIGLEETYPATGWYWTPAGAQFPVYLGASDIAAALHLNRLIQRELTTP